MKQVYICGLDGFRDEIVKKIPEDVVIKGYLSLSDSCECKTFDYYKVYPLCSRIIEKDTYYVIAYNDDDVINDVFQRLRDLGICSSRIITYKRYRDCQAINTMKRFEKMQSEYDVLVFGMSHAKSDIKPSAVSNHMFSFASPSMDIFCHLGIMKQLYTKYPETLSGVKKIVIELPYYAFNYDLSKFGKFAVTKFDYFAQIGSFHNYQNKEVIDGFNAFRSVFLNTKSADYITESMTQQNEKEIKGRIYHLLDMWKVVKNKDKVWTNIYQGAIEENTGLFNELIRLCRLACPNSSIYVLVCPYNPLFVKTHRRMVDVQKEIFYSCLKEQNVEIVDMFDSVKHSELFLDHCHLNEHGAIIWSKALKNRLAIER